MKPISKQMAEFLKKVVGLPLDKKLVNAMSEELIRVEREKELAYKIQQDELRRQESQKSRVIANAGKKIDVPKDFVANSTSQIIPITPQSTITWAERWPDEVWRELKDYRAADYMTGTTSAMSSFTTFMNPDYMRSRKEERGPAYQPPRQPEKKKPRIPKLDERTKRKFSLDE